MNVKQLTTEETFTKNQNWCRLTVCLNHHVKKALIGILHNEIKDPNITGLPSDPSLLYNFMVSNQKKLTKSKVLKEDQLAYLLPQEGKVFSDEFDITLLRFLIRTFTGISNEDRNWNQPRDEDRSIAAAVFRAANIRNRVFHYRDPSSLGDEEFEEIWSQIENTLADLSYAEDISDFKVQSLDPAAIKHFHANMAEDFEKILLAYKEKCKNKDELKNFIERKYQDTSTNEIVTDIDELLKNHQSIMVSAEAGLGKTFSAKNVRYRWASNEILTTKKLLYINSKRVIKNMYKPSYAAPICISELVDVLQNKTDEYLESFGCVQKSIEDLIIIIDGVDELSIKENLDLNYLKELQVKIDKNDEISGMETIIGIYFGFFFPGSKIIVFGRKNEIERLKSIQDDQLMQSTLFNENTRAVLELKALCEEDVKELISRATCNLPKCSCEKCTTTYNLVKDVELRNIPSHLVSLIKIFEHFPNPNFGRITRTKLFLFATFNLLKNHTQTVFLKDVKAFKKLLGFEKAQRFTKCIQNIAKICFLSLYDKCITIQVKEYSENDVEYLQFEKIISAENYCITIERDILEELDFFYIRDLEYHVILEPHHLTNMEFLASCYIYCNPDAWESSKYLSKDRLSVIIPSIAGLHSNDNFTKDFVCNVLSDNSNRNIENYLNWLFSIDNVHLHLPKSSWYGLNDNGRLFPSFYMLYRINEEVDVFDEISKKLKDVKTLVCYCSYDFEWYEMKEFKHLFSTKNKDFPNIESFISFERYNVIVKGDVKITNNEQLIKFNDMHYDIQLIFKINTLFINTSVTNQITNHLKSNELLIRTKCDYCKKDITLDGLFQPTLSTSSSSCSIFRCKVLKKSEIKLDNLQQTEKLFLTLLNKSVDVLSLETFFTQQQIDVLKDVEGQHHQKHINIQLDRINFDKIFELPGLNQRHISLLNIDVTEDDLIKLTSFLHLLDHNHSHSNIRGYKIINSYTPLIRKKRTRDQSFFLHLYEVDFKNISSNVFASTFSLLPSLECKDTDLIPTSHWESLSLTTCRLKELRIWKPELNNFAYFLKIKTSVLQLIFHSCFGLKKVLSYIANNETVQSNKSLKVFVVKVDENDWDSYEEKEIFDNLTIERLRMNYDSIVSSFEDDEFDSFFEGEKKWQNWCCEISDTYNKNSKVVSSGDNFIPEQTETRWEKIKKFFARK